MNETNGILNTLTTNKMDVKIRFNTDFPVKSHHKWRLIVDGVQHLVDAIEINCKCHTTDDIIDVDGIEKEKYHVSCKAKKLSFSTKKDTKKATLS